MSDANIYTAANEYAHRPADERFASLDAMIASAEADRAQCQEAVYNLRDLRILPATHTTDTRQPVPAKTGADASGLLVQSPIGQATLTAYSFDQLCRTVKTPAGFVRQLPPGLTADILNHRLHEWAPHGTAANVLIRDDSAQPYPVIRACTSETYGRLWDGPLYGEVRRWFGDGVRSNGGSWQQPPVWPGAQPGGSYRGDRDSFVIRVDGGSIVTDPRGWSARGQGGGRLHRGIMIRNSEVGECSVTVDCLLFDVICGNHILWGAMIDRKYRRRHVGKKITRDTMQELITLARLYNERSASQDETIIRALVTHEIASSKEAVVDELQKLGYTKTQATEAYATAEAKEPELSPRSFWAIAAGTTRASQESGYQDERLALDQLAAAVLKKGAAQYVTV